MTDMPMAEKKNWFDKPQKEPVLTEHEKTLCGKKDKYRKFGNLDWQTVEALVLAHMVCEPPVSPADPVALENILDGGIKAEHFEDKDHKILFDTALEAHKKLHCVPSLETIGQLALVEGNKPDGATTVKSLFRRCLGARDARPDIPPLAVLLDRMIARFYHKKTDALYGSYKSGATKQVRCLDAKPNRWLQAPSQTVCVCWWCAKRFISCRSVLFRRRRSSPVTGRPSLKTRMCPLRSTLTDNLPFRVPSFPRSALACFAGALAFSSMTFAARSDRRRSFSGLKFMASRRGSPVHLVRFFTNLQLCTPPKSKSCEYIHVYVCHCYFFCSKLTITYATLWLEFHRSDFSLGIKIIFQTPCFPRRLPSFQKPFIAQQKALWAKERVISPPVGFGCTGARCFPRRPRVTQRACDRGRRSRPGCRCPATVLLSDRECEVGSSRSFSKKN